jgi:hypothetical protein
MKGGSWIVGILVLASPILWGADDKTAMRPSAKAVVVDPLDLRKPIPDPQAGLTEKYHGKRVRYTGRVTASGQDAKTKTYWYDLQTDIVHPAGVVNGKKGTTPARGAQKTVKESVLVRAYFPTAQTALKAQPAGNAVTVEGQGEISLVDGGLAIRQASLLDPRFLRLEVPAKP